VKTAALLAMVGVCGLIVPVAGQEPPAEPAPATQPATRPVEPKALSANVLRGLKWLADRQLENGSWDQGEESQQMRNRNQEMGGANVADTAVACLALLRSGSTPDSGAYASHLNKGIEFILTHVEKSDEKSLFVTDVRNTRLQSKLGQYIDTFSAALILAEMKGQMGNDEANKRVLAALDKVMDKIEKNQQADGGFANGGWAPALAQGVASKAVNRAIQNGYDVDATVKQRIDSYAQNAISTVGGRVSMEGAANVELYARSANLQALNDAENANRVLEREVDQVLSNPSTQPAEVVARAQAQRRSAASNSMQLGNAALAIGGRLNDAGFIAGFGSNGGEEFLSYMNIGETLASKGGEEWEKFDKSMTENLNKIQNDDGSWSGHHCITGKTFCTSAALLVLMVDRTPQPTFEKLHKR
jgi:hypothetical protein